VGTPWTKRIQEHEILDRAWFAGSFGLLTGMWNRVRAILFENLGLKLASLLLALLLYAHVVHRAGT